MTLVAKQWHLAAQPKDFEIVDWEIHLSAYLREGERVTSLSDGIYSMEVSNLKVSYLRKDWLSDFRLLDFIYLH